MFASDRTASSITKPFVVCFAFLLACQSVGAAGQQGPGRARATQRGTCVGLSEFAFFEDFLTSFYPELRGKKNLVTSIRSPRDPRVAVAGSGIFEVELSVPPFCCSGGVSAAPGQEPTPETDNSSPSFDFRAAFDLADGQIKNFNTDSFEGSKDFKRVYQDVKEHPDWTDQEAVSRLMSAKPKYSPAQQSELVAELPISQLERFLGKIRVRSVKFLIRDATGLENGHPIVWMTWHVEVETLERRKDDLTGRMVLERYTLQIEPMGGKLTELTKMADMP